MKYAQVVPFEVCNGKEVGTSLFVQGCSMHCFNCFNSSAWDFNGGKKWDEETKQRFFDIVSKPYIKRISFIGGEPLAKQNTSEVLSLINTIRENHSDKKIWLYSGYKLEQIIYPLKLDDFDPKRDAWSEQRRVLDQRKEIVRLCDVLVDGRYVDELKDITLPFRGSSNQRIIDIKKSIASNEVVLYNI